MPQISYGLGAYRRDVGNMPELRLHNMMVEASPTAKNNVVLVSRKGLIEDETVGSGPIQGEFQEPGTFDNDRFVVSGGRLYRDGADLGAVAGNGPASWASSGSEIVVTLGQAAYSYNGTNLAAIAFPDGSNVLAVDYLGQRFVFVPESPPAGPGAFYWSDVNDGRTISGLSFATAESATDGLVDIKVVRGNAYLIGNKTIEPWRTTGNADLPFQYIQQTVSSKGGIGTGCAVEADNSLFWIGNDGCLYRWGETPEALSDAGLNERIIGSVGRQLFKFDYDARPLVIIKLDDDVFAYDCSTRQLHSLKSYGLDRFRISCAINNGTAAYLGDETTNQIWTFSGFEDADGEHERLFTAYFGIDTGNVVVDNLWIEANVGWTDLLTGQGSDPQIEMRYSDNAGATWADWEAVDLGEQGQYRVVPEWRGLGSFDPPGFLAEFRISDPVGFRVSAVHVNDPLEGRAR